MQPGYLKVKEVAVMAGVSLGTVRRWIKTGRLPAYRLSSRIIRIKVEDWEKLRSEF
jgi:excisionase family DNA binding protein